jgi:hypothetical protein
MLDEPELLDRLIKAYRDEMPDYKAGITEKHVVADIVPGVKLQGHIDLITKDGIIVDHKTAARRWPEYRAHQDLQPTAYYILYKSLRGEFPERFEFHIVTKAPEPKVQILETSRSEQTVEWYKEGLLEALDAIETGIFPPNPSYMYCSEKYCFFWHKCRERKIFYEPF